MLQFLKKRWVYHSLIWLSMICFLTYVVWMDGNSETTLLLTLQETLLETLPVLLVVYVSFWAKEHLFDTRKYYWYGLATVTTIAAGAYLYRCIDLYQDSVGNNMSQDYTNFIFYYFGCIGVQYFKRGIINQYQFQELKAKKIGTELNALKAQINPHFLFNTLNNIYGMNQIDSEKGSEMIMELSEVMRYHLEFSKIGLIKVEDEVQLIHSYIKLETLRLTNNCDLIIDLDELDGDLMISPLLFLPFVENAFKHGTHPNQPCYIDIRLRTEEKRLTFQIRNSIIRNRNIVKTNIGLENTKRRLELIYPDKHQLNISEEDNSYFVNLSIDL